MRTTRCLLGSLLLLATPSWAGQAVLEFTGGVLGDSVSLDLAGDPGQTALLVPSLSMGPTPLPNDSRVLDVGLDLISYATLTVLSNPAGSATIVYPLPSDPMLVGSVVYAQFVTLPGVGHPVDEISNRIVFVAALHGSTVDTAGLCATARQGHSVTALLDGRVLVAGGDEPDSLGNLTALDTLEIYDPETQSFNAIGATLSHPRSTHTATRLADGRVLLVGGYDQTGTVRRTADLFDPVTNSVTAAAIPLAARTQHTATLLADGRLFLVGGSSRFDLDDVLGSLALAAKSCEIYDPTANTWSNAASLPISQNGIIGHAASRLGNGQVLVTGGVKVQIVFGLPIPSVASEAWRYDALSNAWIATASMGIERVYHGQITLADGRALVAGGADGDFVTLQFFTLTHCARYDAATNLWTTVGSLTSARAYPNLVDTGALIAVVGGLLDVDVTTGSGTPAQALETSSGAFATWTHASDLRLPREVARAAVIDLGLRVLVVGTGDDGTSNVDRTAELFVP